MACGLSFPSWRALPWPISRGPTCQRVLPAGGRAPAAIALASPGRVCRSQSSTGWAQGSDRRGHIQRHYCPSVVSPGAEGRAVALGRAGRGARPRPGAHSRWGRGRARESAAPTPKQTGQEYGPGGGTVGPARGEAADRTETPERARTSGVRSGGKSSSVPATHLTGETRPSSTPRARSRVLRHLEGLVPGWCGRGSPKGSSSPSGLPRGLIFLRRLPSTPGVPWFHSEGVS